ncbi:MAG TPA: aromatic-ring-hydroxylating dioxygenase subunit beta [Burkholderiaceae bacterium]|nr:aromatic-ring-hydroxylating dioxygenase subunit beta [Burkholderiaceae bacterium]
MGEAMRHGTGLPADLSAVVLQHRVEQFLYQEAALLDERRFDEWLKLFHPDVHYLMPNRFTQTPRDARGSNWGKEGFALFDDDLASLASRVKRLATGNAWAEEPPSRTRHMVFNIRIAQRDAETIEVSLNFAIYRSRRERDEDVFFGAREDRLKPIEGTDGFTILSRTIHLDQTVLTHHNLSIFF